MNALSAFASIDAIEIVRSNVQPGWGIEGQQGIGDTTGQADFRKFPLWKTRTYLNNTESALTL